MPSSTVIYILISIIFNTSGQLLLKGGTNRLGLLQLTPHELPATLMGIVTQPFIMSGLFCYVLSVTLWIIALSRMDVMIAYPLLSLGYIINAAGAWYFLGEMMTWQRLIGIAIIILGVYILIKS